MADYFTKISFAFHCSADEAERLDAAFALDGEEITDETPIDDVLKPFWPTAVDFARAITGEPHDTWLSIGVEEAVLDEDGFWIQSDNPNLEAIAAIIQTLCQETLAKGPIGFMWANDCSRPRLDAYGGGACAIFKDRIEFESTHTVLDKMLSEAID